MKPVYALRLGFVLLALCCGLCAVALLALPLVLALLMVLFDDTAHGLLVLLGLSVGWFRSMLPSGSGLPPYRSLALDPGAIALASALRLLPCLLGFALAILTVPMRGRVGLRAGWWLVSLSWLVAIVLDRGLASWFLAPGCAAAFCAALASQAIDRRSRPAR